MTFFKLQFCLLAFLPFVYLPAFHFVNRSFCPPDILSICCFIFCKHVILSTWHFVYFIHCQIDITSTWYFINLIFCLLAICHFAILTTWHFAYLLICQLIILLARHFINLPFYQIFSFIYVPFYQLPNTPACHLIYQAFCQLLIYLQFVNLTFS